MAAVGDPRVCCVHHGPKSPDLNDVKRDTQNDTLHIAMEGHHLFKKGKMISHDHEDAIR